MTRIKAGYGFNVGYDFARAAADTPIEVRTESRGMVYGTIAGDPQSKLGFLRAARVHVEVRRDCLTDD